MDDNELMAERNDEPVYRQPEDMNASELREALGRLQLLDDDPFLHTEFYISTTPARLLQPILKQQDTKSLTDYLDWRYWSGT